MAKLRGAISGFGQVVTHAHLPTYHARDDIEIVAVHEPVAERAYEASRLLPKARIYRDLEAMLEAERLDFLDIASPPEFHAVSAATALRAGVNVLVEKPLCLTLEECDRLTQLASRQGLVLYCVDNWRYAPSFRTAFALLKKGWLGELNELSFTRLRSVPAGGH